MKSVVKKIIIFVIILFAISMVKYTFFPAHWKEGDWSSVAYQLRCLYDFCTYKVPDAYKFSDYREGDYKRLLIYQNTSSEQIFLISKLKEFQKVDINKTKTSPQKVRLAYANEQYPVNDFFKLMYILPLLRDDSLKNASDGLVIKGFELKNQEKITTSETDIIYFEGNFQDKIGFYKPNERLFLKYPVPVFRFFKNSYKGAIAIITNKMTGDTLISIGAVPSHKNFNAQEYKDILKTVSFKTIPWEDPMKLRRAGRH